MRNSKEIYFSVLVPVYNAEQYLRDSIESVIKQTYKHFELIIVDDGSIDCSGEICDYYKSIDSRIRVYHNQNNGILLTRRFALSKARGDYFVFLDSDDKLKDNALEIIRETIEQDKSDCIIYGYERVHEGKVIDTYAESEKKVLCNKSEIFLKVFTHTEYNALWRKAFKATILDGRDYSAFDGVTMGEDLLLSVEILENSRKVSFIPNVLYEYVLNPSSLTQSVKYTNYSVDNRVRSLVKDVFLGLEEVSEKERVEYKFFCQVLATNEIKTISAFDCDKRKKRELLKELYNDEYYQRYIFAKPNVKYKNLYDLIVFCLFKRQKFDAILVISKIVQRGRILLKKKL